MTEHLLECLAFGKCDDPDCFHGKPICICDALRACKNRALDDAVQRVAAFIDPWPNMWPGLIRRQETIIAIKGDQP